MYKFRGDYEKKAITRFLPPNQKAAVIISECADCGLLMEKSSINPQHLPACSKAGPVRRLVETEYGDSLNKLKGITHE